MLELQRAAAQVVEDAAGRADDEMHTLLQRDELAADALAAVDRHAAAGRRSATSLRGLLGDLHDQFARRREDERLRAGRFVLVPPVEERQQERGGLAGAGLGLADHVAAVEGVRDQGGLNRRRRGILDALERGEHALGQMQ